MGDVDKLVDLLNMVSIAVSLNLKSAVFIYYDAGRLDYVVNFNGTIHNTALSYKSCRIQSV